MEKVFILAMYVILTKMKKIIVFKKKEEKKRKEAWDAARQEAGLD